MSSDQISETPLPPEKKRCLHCGEVISSTAAMCELCQVKFAIQEGTPDPRRKAALPMEGEAPAGNGVLWAIVIIVGLAFVAAAFNAPSTLCIGLFAMPAVVLYLIQRKALSGVAWFGIILLVAVSAFIAFAVVCTSI